MQFANTSSDQKKSRKTKKCIENFPNPGKGMHQMLFWYFRYLWHEKQVNQISTDIKIED